MRQRGGLKGQMASGGRAYSIGRDPAVCRRTNPIARAIILAALALLVLAAPARARYVEYAFVSRVVDGDTIHVDLRGMSTTVRLIGVDTPELHDRRDATSPPQPFAREAAAYTRHELNGKRVRLEYERHERYDVYGRTLAYVFLEDGTFFNRELVRSGYARAYTRFPFHYRKQFRADEAEARRAGRGLWAHPSAPLHGVAP